MFGDLEENTKNYPVKKLSDIADYWNGLTYKPANAVEDGIGTLVLRSSNIQNGELAFEDNVFVDCSIKEKLFVQDNDILMCSRNGSAALVGKTALIKGLKEPTTFGAFMMIIRSQYYPYLKTYFELPYFRNQISTGTSTINQITGKMLNDFQLPVPNMEAVRIFEDFVHQSDKSKFTGFKSQFIEMFYDKGYPVKTIGDVIDKKISRVAKVFEKTDEIQYLDISSIDNSSRTVTGLTPYVLKDAPSRAQYVLKHGDIMYSTVRPNLQNIAINPYSEDNVVGSTGFCVLRCIGVTTGYMWGVINSVPFTESMVNQASGANYPAVTDKVVHAYEIPIPPEEAQNDYEQLVKQSDKSK